MELCSAASDNPAKSPEHPPNKLKQELSIRSLNIAHCYLSSGASPTLTGPLPVRSRSVAGLCCTAKYPSTSACSANLNNCSSEPFPSPHSKHGCFEGPPGPKPAIACSTATNLRPCIQHTQNFDRGSEETATSAQKYPIHCLFIVTSTSPVQHDAGKI